MSYCDLNAFHKQQIYRSNSDVGRVILIDSSKQNYSIHSKNRKKIGNEIKENTKQNQQVP